MGSEAIRSIVCPLCKGDLKTDQTFSSLACAACGLDFPVRNGIPVMLADEARRSDTLKTDRDAERGS